MFSGIIVKVVIIKQKNKTVEIEKKENILGIEKKHMENYNEMVIQRIYKKINKIHI